MDLGIVRAARGDLGKERPDLGQRLTTDVLLRAWIERPIERLLIGVDVEVGSSSVTPSSSDVSRTAFSPNSRMLRPNAWSPSYQWTRTRSPSSTFQSKRSSSYLSVTGGPSVPVRSSGLSYTRQRAVILVFG
jgi:hypothetical protein